MIKKSLVSAIAMVGLVSIGFPSLSHAVSLPGIPPSGSPDFTHSAQINLFSLGPTGFLMAVTNSGADISFNGPAGVSTSPGNYLLTAQFTPDGAYVANSGNLSISGSVPYPGLPGVSITGDLLTAKLTGFNFDANTLGFATFQTIGYGTLFGVNESAYLTGNGIGDALGFSNHHLVATGSPLLANAITTVPLPSAAWLFGSAMFGLAKLARRKPA